jgi:hypothetical protein
MRRLRRNHQKQPIIDRLGATLGLSCVPAALAPTFWLRAAPEPPCVPLGFSTRLPAWGSSRGAACPSLPPGSGQLSGRLHHPPPDAGQLRGSRVSPQLRFPPPGLGKLRGHHMSPGLQHLPPGAGQLRGRRVSPWLRDG